MNQSEERLEKRKTISLLLSPGRVEERERKRCPKKEASWLERKKEREREKISFPALARSSPGWFCPRAAGLSSRAHEREREERERESFWPIMSLAADRKGRRLISLTYVPRTVRERERERKALSNGESRRETPLGEKRE